MQRLSRSSLWQCFSRAGVAPEARLWASDASVDLRELASGTALAVPLEKLRGRTALVSTSDQLAAALALIEMDGIARRLVLCPPDLDPRHLPYVIATAGVDVIITDGALEPETAARVHDIVPVDRRLDGVAVDRTPVHETEWVLFTSGTTGVPKMVEHTLATLTGAIEPNGALAGSVVWATFYDVRRYGGLQILLRAVLGAGSLVLSSPGEDSASFLMRAREHRVTHITGTPSHWRRALMSSAMRSVSPTYVRLSGEIADQALLDRLRSVFPDASIAHAFASTEAGVVFEVTDGQAGFPMSFVGRYNASVDITIEDGTLRVRSARTALSYLGNTSESLLDANGFVDTCDVIEQRGERGYFAGRRGGIINVGGLKIHPEEVEAVINRHPRVRMSLVSARRSAITGAVVAADVVLASGAEPTLDATTVERTKAEIIATCRDLLPAHKVPASIRVVDAVVVTPSGKLQRRDA